MSQVDPLDDAYVHEGAAALQRMAQLGVPVARLYEALDAGDVAARQADEFSPVNAAGMLRWMETVRKLREGLAGAGWVANDDRLSPRCISPDGSLAVVPVSGTPDTGHVDGNPRSAHARGEASSRAVQVNGQLSIPFSTPVLLADMSAERNADVLTYFLLYFRSQEDELRAELSLPVAISDKGVIGGWRERILLPPRTFGADLMLPRDAGGDDDVDFDISAL